MTQPRVGTNPEWAPKLQILIDFLTNGLYFWLFYFTIIPIVLVFAAHDAKQGVGKCNKPEYTFISPTYKGSLPLIVGAKH